jgi:hypothetical protein
MNIDTDITKQKIGYGIKNGQLVHVDDVSRGLDCNSACPSCGGKLIAKKGDSNIHHFAHHDGDSDHCGESVLHKVSKEIILAQKQLFTPSTLIEVSENNILGESIVASHTHSSREYLFDQVSLEQSEEGFKPDVTAEYCQRKVFIEIKVSHGVSEEKLAKVRELGIPMIEIDMSGYNAMDNLNKLTAGVIKDAPRHWVYHPKHEELKFFLKSQLEEKFAYRNGELRKILIGLNGTKSEMLSFILSDTLDDESVIVLGYRSVSGYSRKNNSDFKFAELKIGEKVSSSGSMNFNIKASGGIEEYTIAVDESILPDLQYIGFPCIAKLSLGTKFSRGKGVPIVTALEVI